MAALMMLLILAAWTYGLEDACAFKAALAGRHTR